RKELTLTVTIVAQQHNAQGIRFETEQLTYFAHDERMSTNTPVRIQQGANITTAGGMEANSKSGVLDIHKPVESRSVSEYVATYYPSIKLMLCHWHSPPSRSPGL